MSDSCNSGIGKDGYFNEQEESKDNKMKDRRESGTFQGEGRQFFPWLSFPFPSISWLRWTWNTFNLLITKEGERERERTESMMEGRGRQKERGMREIYCIGEWIKLTCADWIVVTEYFLLTSFQYEGYQEFKRSWVNYHKGNKLNLLITRHNLTWVLYHNKKARERGPYAVMSLSHSFGVKWERDECVIHIMWMFHHPSSRESIVLINGFLWT